MDASRAFKRFSQGQAQPAETLPADQAAALEAPEHVRKPGHVAAFIRAYYARRAGDLTVPLPENPTTYARRMRKLAAASTPPST
ncbi:MAG: hypothetical protein ACLQU2_02415 [Candidatus Binataceae bacterium]